MTHPLHLVIVDELATLTAYAPMDVRRRAEYALGRLLTKGAAVGWVVLGCVQEPSKDIIPMRGLFTYRIALGLDTRRRWTWCWATGCVTSVRWPIRSR
ncbi:hypothetical protein [Actinocatenispora sera]|uniref:FtsK domain-containing protein n=1 Tax=Actinocatenispora sera TaxID=390989 RepID=A0A810L5K7_9ACTN|nr:hypothetical protein [Actinocatenispora sera]BCJ29621.1 hypothetical protein Asera_37290 [Actinocatenispora sera]